MSYQPELRFLQNVLENMHLHATVLKEPYENAALHDHGIRKLVYPDIEYVTYIKNFCYSCPEKVIYKAYDEFLLNYLILKLPDKEPSCLLIGPYTLVPWDEHILLNKAQEFHISPEVYPIFRKCYNDVPLVTDASILINLVNTFSATLWGSMDAFSMLEVQNISQVEDSFAPNYEYDPNELFRSLEHIEQRFRAESEFMQIVSHGQLHKIEMYVNMINLQGSEVRLADRIRNAKNYAIIMNTLLRKAAENGSVHPIHIDRVSSDFAKKIELQTSEKGVSTLIKEMARKYTLLVKNHSMQGYSTLVRKALIQIDSDLSADLTLRTLSALLDVNPSYLSTVFKKETGQTLTEYVTGKRIEHAIFLLNCTNMQIQTIAQYCGIPDICYFTKIFKKMVGKSPSEYKNTIRH